MISIVCVYNNDYILKKNLLKSLKNQKTEYEIILVNNTTKKFKSASEALNYAGNLANKEFLLFIHQDVCLIGNDWLEKCENLIKKNEYAIYGICGWTKYGRIYNSGIDSKQANPSDIVEVLTIDEQLLIVPFRIFKKFKFDEDFDDWHCYIADYCLNLKRSIINSYVLGLPILHNSPKTNRKIDKLRMEQYKLLKKYQNEHNVIFTNGVICDDKFTRFLCGLALKMQEIRLTYFFGYIINYFYLKFLYY